MSAEGITCQEVGLEVEVLSVEVITYFDVSVGFTLFILIQLKHCLQRALPVMKLVLKLKYCLLRLSPIMMLVLVQFCLPRYKWSIVCKRLY